MKSIFKKILFACLIFSIALFFVHSVIAASEATKTVSLDNPVTQDANPSKIIGLFIKAAIGLVGGLTLVMVVYGGFMWLTAAGNKEKIESGSKTMLWAVIGLILTLGSYLLVDTVLKFLSNNA